MNVIFKLKNYRSNNENTTFKKNNKICINFFLDITCLNNCSGNGECNQQTGICNCGELHSGPDCSCNLNTVYFDEKKIIGIFKLLNFFVVKKCPNDCNGHGVCNRITGKCKCEFLYGGSDCHGNNYF